MEVWRKQFPISAAPVLTYCKSQKCNFVALFVIVYDYCIPFVFLAVIIQKCIPTVDKNENAFEVISLVHTVF